MHFRHVSLLGLNLYTLISESISAIKRFIIICLYVLIFSCTTFLPPLNRYQWKFNDRPLHAGLEHQAVGSLQFTVDAFSQGTYQCTASNQHGTAVSDRITLIQAKLEKPSFERMPKVYTVTEGEPLGLPCLNALSVPRAPAQWLLAQGVVDYFPRPYTLSRRVQVDSRGSLTIG